MPVVVQTGFRIVVLTLEANGVFDFRNLLFDDVAVGPVGDGPDELTLLVGQFLGGAQVVQFVLVELGVVRAMAF